MVRRMTIQKNKSYFFLFFILTILFVSGVSHKVLAATEENDLKTSSGIEVSNLITLASSILATALFVISFIAYRRDRRNKLLFVSIAFLLFAVKGFLLTSDIFFPSKGAWVDPAANTLDLFVLACFFIGLIKK